MYCVVLYFLREQNLFQDIQSEDFFVDWNYCIFFKSISLNISRINKIILPTNNLTSKHHIRKKKLI